MRATNVDRHHATTFESVKTSFDSSTFGTFETPLGFESYDSDFESDLKTHGNEE